MLVFSTGGLEKGLDAVRASLLASGNLQLRLFQNNITPDQNTTVGDFTEATFSGYAAQTIATWGSVSLDGDNNAVVEEINRTFTQSGTTTINDIYGYYVVDTSTTALLVWSERAPSPPFAMDASGKTYTVLPRLVLKNFS